MKTKALLKRSTGFALTVMLFFVMLAFPVSAIAAEGTYTVTFMDGETILTTRNVTAPATTVSSLPTPTKSGYTFEGWFTGESGTGTQFTISTPVTGDMIVYAKWTSTIIVNYSFDGNVLDASGKGNHGTIGGTASFESGYSGQAIRLDGNGWISLPQYMILNNTSFTISMMFKTSSSGGLFGYQNNVVGSASDCTQYVPVLSIGSNGRLYAEMWTGNSMVVSSGSAVNDNQWHRVVMTSGTNSIRVYLDGVDIGGATGTPQHLSMHLNQIGTNAAWGRNYQPPAFTWNKFAGLIDDFTFYSNAQSAAEIAKTTQTITFEPLPVMYTSSVPFTLTATAGSGLPVIYASSNPAVASISGSTVTIRGAGTATISANQPGDTEYSAAPQVVQTLTVEAVETNTPPNRKAPVSAETTAAVAVNTAYTLDLSTIFEDADDDPLTYTVSVNGAAAEAADANYSYTPAVEGTITLLFKASDGEAESADTYFVTLTASATNTPPNRKAAVNAETTATVTVNTAYTLDLSTIFEDADGDPLTYTVSVNGAAAEAANANYSYTPTGEGTVTLLFKASDEEAESADTYSVILTAYLQHASYNPPSIASDSVANVTLNGAKLYSSFRVRGGKVTEQGFVYGASQNLILGQAGIRNITSEIGTGTFSATITGLEPNTTYYARPYAIGSFGIMYGEVMSFTTIAADGSEVVGIPKTGDQTAILGLMGTVGILLGSACVLRRRRLKK